MYADGTPSQIAACSECNTLFALPNMDIAEKCCTCYTCGVPIKRQISNPKLYCNTCDRKQREEREAANLERAELVEGYTGPVYTDAVSSGGWGDGYFESAEDLSDYLANDELPQVEFAFCCTPTLRGPAIDDASDLVANGCEESYEGMEESVEGVEELQAAIDAFRTKNAHLVSYMPDYKRKVRILQIAAEPALGPAR
jgi:hypothetical protein